MIIDLACPNCAHCLMSDEADAFIPKMGKVETCANCSKQFEVLKKHFQKHLDPEKRKKAMEMKIKAKGMMEAEIQGGTKPRVKSNPNTIGSSAPLSESRIAEMVDKKVSQKLDAAKPENASGVLFLIISTLSVGIILIFTWVGSMSLIQKPNVALNVITWLVVLQTSIAVAYERKSILWLIGMLLLWLFALPYHAIKKYEIAGILGVIALEVIFILSYLWAASTIAQAAERLSRILG